ncbi:hypothetical protein ACH42_04600 [Endozoicomonas sp. (ex Bugula neritina AB1)]|nr:hypothetical protein ACH42_04600 [Endozoicomonas sp. (ex Bugula neritina AB1)]
MSFDIKKEGGWSVVSIEEVRLDAVMAETFKTYLFEQIEAGSSQMIIDLESVRFMDSSGLGALVAALKKLPENGTLKLAAAQPAVRDLFDLTSMEKLFTIYATLDEAIQGD